ncbi:restriction endonuclease [Bacteroides salyersiae]|jgi:type II restriction endonuclease|uniref:type II restriction endonuclease n=1 Tax=Bacteroides salyersiae TaxID=291644 RepID=UPI001C38A66C|nr:type II restriction endonuclease [Bacteroides salyersiae]MBV4203959.1 restriction endonuclease [Bacteroides salyersiae]MCB6648990.1 restriction endonuclease [Bacteroides salyersiae]
MSEILNSAICKVQNAKHAFCRFITANDTGKNGSHQAGFYIPKCAAPLLFDVPGEKGENKDKLVKVKWQDDFVTESRFIYYGQGTRNEYRITRFGKSFPFFEEDNVGDLLIIAQQSEDYYHGFILQTDQDIDDFFAYFNLSSEMTNQLIDVKQADTPEKQLETGIQELVTLYTNFPETKQMAKFAREIYNKVHKITDTEVCKNPDLQLLKWIDTEYSLFRAFEEKVYAPIYSVSFPNCQELVKFSNVILNRRKSRAGKSLEHHLATIFTAARLEFEEQAVTEDNKKPDFLFPNGEAYHNLLFPSENLVFLGAKTTCKDRWRQVLNEANRIETKYLFTLQQGISKNQLREMKHEHLKLVVPASYRASFDKEFQPEIETLASFVEMVKMKQNSKSIYSV